MKKIISNAVFLMLLGTFVFMSCKKENNQNSEPVLPPTESMLIDFSNFQASSLKSVLADNTMTYDNWTPSAITVGFWSAMIYLNSAIPVAAFKESFNHQGVFTDNTTFTKTYSITNNEDIYTCKLEGTVNSNTTDWKMYLSKESGSGTNFSDFLWFSGTSSNDATTATWHLNRGPELNGRQYLDITWVKNISLRYTMVDVMDAGVGNWLEYDKINEAGLNAQFLIHTVDHTYDIDIQWGNANKNGRVKCQNWFGDLNWHCWGVNYENTICN